MTTQQILPPEEFNIPQYLPKFSIRHKVVWAGVEAHDRGTIIGCVWANQTSCKASGYHYLIQLAPTSDSYSFCKQDWAFEQDIELARRSRRSCLRRNVELLEEFNDRSSGGVT